MDRKQLREQITRRYVTGKALDGASVDEIAKGVVDPVEQMNYVTRLSKTKPTTNTECKGSNWLFLLIFCSTDRITGSLYSFLMPFTVPLTIPGLPKNLSH